MRRGWWRALVPAASRLPWRSSLARRAVEGRALPVAQRPDRRLAGGARLSLAAVDHEALLEVSGTPVGRGGIPPGRAPRPHRALDGAADRGRQPVPAGP